MARVLHPRRKFNVNAEIKCALARFKRQQQLDWEPILEKNKLRFITELYSEHFLYVKGQKSPEVDIDRSEILTYMYALPYPEPKEQPTGRRMAQIPIFFNKDNVAGSYTHLSPLASRKRNYALNKMLTYYQNVETYHKTQESHHPDGIGWNGGIDATIECVFDVYASLLRKNTVKNAYSKLLTILSDEKFANLTPAGILFACLHIIIRGVSASIDIRTLSLWREKEYSQQDLWELTTKFQTGSPPISMLNDYYKETKIHSNVISTELRRLRISHSTHDYTKFSSQSLYWYTWHWGGGGR